MQFPESWLREFCNPPLSTSQLAELLTMSGIEVEELRSVAPPFSGVVVAQVLDVQAHPNADRLRVCRVDAGGDAPLTIVCGAPNVQVGVKVPCALVGARLPAVGDAARAAASDSDAAPAAQAGIEIKPATMRGVTSQGMLCSARELQLSDDHGGLLILSDAAQVGDDVRKTLALDDTIFDVSLTPNLGHCLSVYGIAREVAALTGAPLQAPPTPLVTPSNDARLHVVVEATDLCGRFSGRIVEGVNATAKTPQWMVERLRRCGQRSVTALVDISNYVMFESGQPTHIFDRDKINGSLTVRWGRSGEQLALLNGQTVSLDDQVGVIADAQRVESLAGVMGGDATAVSDDTRNIYIEAAFWWPDAVAGRARRFGFATDAAHRFERGVDPTQTVARIERITQLVLDICGGTAGPIDDQPLRVPEAKTIMLRVARAAQLIGMPITQADCESVMRRLGFAFTASPGALAVTPPPWRFDLQIEEDLVEEVIRLMGYQRLPSTPPTAAIVALPNDERRRSAHDVRRLLVERGYFETINFGFVEERWERELAGNQEPIRVLNPIASPLAVMRSSLLGSLIDVLRRNLARKTDRVRIFEIGRVFRRDPNVAEGPLSVSGVDQPMRIAGLAYGTVDALQWGASPRVVDFFDVKGDVEALLAPQQLRFIAASHPALHPGRSARVVVNGDDVGWVGELHPRWRQAYELPQAPVLFELDSARVMQRPLPVAASLSRQQPVWRDLSLVINDAVTHERLLQAVGMAASPTLRTAWLTDMYKPKVGTTNLAGDEHGVTLRLELLDAQSTLTDERIAAEVGHVLDTLKSEVRARLRV